MMKANEAYELTVKVLTEGADSHLMKIEEEIKKACARGYFHICYGHGLSGEEAMAKQVVLTRLTDAGYTYHWNSGQLIINWEKR